MDANHHLSTSPPRQPPDPLHKHMTNVHCVKPHWGLELIVIAHDLPHPDKSQSEKNFGIRAETLMAEVRGRAAFGTCRVFASEICEKMELEGDAGLRKEESSYSDIY